MTDIGTIPVVRDDPRGAMDEWCSELANRGLLFHPDDPSDSIAHICTGDRLFSFDECRRLDGILDCFAEHGGAPLHGACLYDTHTQRRLRIPPG